ncbi:MAG: hypothetical protein BK997_03380 [Candidatus Micrarchaeum sp. ARMAN-1]|nr:MAG: hypothetical protein BK997_03380 [Candidatus Micrarchaeum sp. ARMAN-1]
MEISELRNKIPEVLAYARTVSKRNGHTRKYAKHIVALVIKQIMHLTDKELAKFLSTNWIGKILGYKRHFNHTIFSKVRSTAAKNVKELYEFLVYQKMRGKRIRFIAIDSTDIQAFSSNDKDAKYGHRTPSKKEQRTLRDNAKTLFFGYKLHAIADAETEMPIAVEIASANRHDKTFFHRLYAITKETFHVHMNPNAKVLADSGYDSTDIHEELHYDSAKPVIAINGRGFYKSSIPKDPEYGKRWAVERVFSRLKEVFGLSKNRFIGMKKVVVHIYSCLLAYLVKYL